MNSKPVGMHERLWGAHDLILKAWSTHDPRLKGLD